MESFLLKCESEEPRKYPISCEVAFSKKGYQFENFSLRAAFGSSPITLNANSSAEFGTACEFIFKNLETKFFINNPPDKIALKNIQTLRSDIFGQDLVKTAILIFNWLEMYFLAPEAIDLRELVYDQFILNNKFTLKKIGAVSDIYFIPKPIRDKNEQNLKYLTQKGLLIHTLILKNGNGLVDNYCTPLHLQNVLINQGEPVADFSLYKTILDYRAKKLQNHFK